MFKNYLKIAMRNLLKRKIFSLINILGLAIGMTVCLLIILFIRSEVGYDAFYKNSDQIYRIALDRKYPGRSTSYAIIPSSIGAAIKQEFPEVKEFTRFFDFSGNNGFTFNIGDKVFDENNVYAADSTFFKVLPGEVVAGDVATALTKPNSAVLSQTMAEKMFGTAAIAIGKQFETNAGNGNKISYMVNAVTRDLPVNSHLHYAILISSVSFPPLAQPNYTGFSAYTYLLLDKNASTVQLEAKIPQVIEKYASGAIGQAFGVTYERFQATGNGYHYFLQPVKDIHLKSDLEAELSPNGSTNTIYVLAIIALFILALACINFINLSTSLSVERAKEVGIRKTFGSERKAIIAQFLFESVLICFLSVVLAFILIALFIPLFNQVAHKDLTILYFFTPLNLLAILSFTVLIGLVAGIYPAFILSSFNPIIVLKGKFKSNKYGLLLRNGLVVFQFAISTVLIIATITVNSQIRFMIGGKLGFNKEHVILVNNTFELGKNTEVFKNEVLNIPGVTDVSKASTVPGNQNFFGIIYQVIGAKKPTTGRGIVVDENYAKLLNLEITQGRFFSKDFPADSASLVLNETAVDEMELKQPIGAQVISPGVTRPDGTAVVFTVVGVVRDFHYQSLHQKITPLMFSYAGPGAGSILMAVRIKSANIPDVVAQLNTRWSENVKNKPFHYSFLDQTVAAQYQSEETTRRLFTIFSALAIFIACMGLMGLAAYATQQRMREIGIRKVLGASVKGIITMLSVDFLKLILWSTLLAFPVAWLGIHNWLQNFAYRIDVSLWVFILAAFISVTIALLTISFHALRAAFSNPVKSLRSE